MGFLALSGSVVRRFGRAGWPRVLASVAAFVVFGWRLRSGLCIHIYRPPLLLLSLFTRAPVVGPLFGLWPLVVCSPCSRPGAVLPSLLLPSLSGRPLVARSLYVCWLAYPSPAARSVVFAPPPPSASWHNLRKLFKIAHSNQEPGTRFEVFTGWETREEDY